MKESKQTYARLKEVARRLYMEDEMSQRKIAEALQISETGLSKWVTEGNWEDARARHIAEQGTLREDAFFLLKYQIRAIKHFCQEQENSNPDNLKPIDNSYVDGLSKLFKNLSKDQLSYEEKIRFVNEFSNFTAALDPDAAKRLMPIAKEFLNQARERL